jgi:CheY-like chemotaxis protein
MILLVDNNLGDQELIQLALEEAGVASVVHKAIDGFDGQAHLQAVIDGAPPYRLLLIDINMPRMDGRSLLTWVRAQPALKDIPVIMITSSPRPADRQECLDLGATRFVVKPMDFLGFCGLASEVREYVLE